MAELSDAMTIHGPSTIRTQQTHKRFKLVLLLLQLCIIEIFTYVDPGTLRNVSRGPLAHDESNAMLILANAFFVVRIQLFR